MSQNCSALFWGEELEAGADESPQTVDRVCRRLAQDRFEFGEELLDRIEIGTIGWQIDEHCAARLDGLANTTDLMNADIIHDDDVAALEGRREHLFDVGLKACAVHRAVQHQRRGDTVVAQGRNEG